jgi:arabinan endo-1,5-alpha-L-arabinosidase
VTFVFAATSVVGVCLGSRVRAGPACPGATAPLDMRPVLLDADCPDPCLVRAPDGWLLVATTYFEDIDDKLPLWWSRDLERWEHTGFVFPRGRSPAWAEGQFWAPEIHPVEGGWHCYFTAREASGRLVIGVAFADHPTGPWRDSGRPLLRDERIGIIDAHRFDDDDGRAYLYWKEDGNDLNPRARTPIRVQELARDGLSVVGARHTALLNDLVWEAHVVEGPWAVRRGEHVYLFYSGNAFHTADYATGVARARHPVGPFEKLPQPILVSGPRWRGPGHGCVVAIDGADFFVHHAWDGERIFGRHPRIPLASQIRWSGGWPEIAPLADPEGRYNATQLR